MIRWMPADLGDAGPKDIIAPLASAKEMRGRLKQAESRRPCWCLPQVDHGFDLFATNWSPSARMSLWHTERFLALMAA